MIYVWPGAIYLKCVAWGHLFGWPEATHFGIDGVVKYRLFIRWPWALVESRKTKTAHYLGETGAHWDICHIFAYCDL